MNPNLNDALVAGLLVGVLWAVVTGCQKQDSNQFPPQGTMSVRVGQGYSPFVGAVGNSNIDPYGVSAGGWKAPQ